MQAAVDSAAEVLQALVRALIRAPLARVLEATRAVLGSNLETIVLLVIQLKVKACLAGAVPEVSLWLQLGH